MSGLALPIFPKGATPIDLDFAATLPLRGAPDQPKLKLIRFEELSRISFPEILAPLAIPKPAPPALSAEAAALLAPTPIAAPWDPPACVPVATSAPRKRRRWPKIFLAATLGAVTGWGFFQTPLARDPHIRPYADVVNAKTKQGVIVAKAGTARGVAWSVGVWNTYVR